MYWLYIIAILLLISSPYVFDLVRGKKKLGDFKNSVITILVVLFVLSIPPVVVLTNFSLNNWKESNAIPMIIIIGFLLFAVGFLYQKWASKQKN